MTPTSLRIAIDLGPGDEHESRRLFSPLKGRISESKVLEDPGAEQSRFILTPKVPYTPLVMMMYLAGRRGIAACIKEQVNRKEMKETW